MDTIARQLGETLVARGTAEAINRWGFWRVAGLLGLAALAAYALSARYRAQHATPLLPAPSDAKGAAPPPDQERRRVPEFEQHQDESRTLH